MYLYVRAYIICSRRAYVFMRGQETRRVYDNRYVYNIRCRCLCVCSCLFFNRYELRVSKTAAETIATGPESKRPDTQQHIKYVRTTHTSTRLLSR